MRIVVLGATGNLGTSLLGALEADPEVDSVVGVARRRPDSEGRGRYPKVEWRGADIARADLTQLFGGADAVVHLAWLIQPSRDEATTRLVNIVGSDRVFRAVAEAGVPKLVYSSSVGAYAPGPKDRAVDETHPRGGIPTSFYARHKAEVERRLDGFEAENPSVAVTRIRPALIFKGAAGAEIRRLFAGPLLPNRLLRRNLIPFVPAINGLRFQAVHSLDAGEAFRLAIHSKETGAFNIAADPVLDPPRLAGLLGARTVKLPAPLLRAVTDISWRLRLQPTPPGWLDMALNVPLMDSGRARELLGWTPRRSSEDALLELLDGLREGRGAPTPPLDPDAGGALRGEEFRSGVGGRNP